MIPFDLLTDIAEKLTAFRGNGRDMVLFDSRDQGNYHEHDWDQTSSLLKSADPTGFSLALLINEMIEATIDGSKVPLSRVLREPGFVEKLHDILDLKARLSTVLDYPMENFHQRIHSMISEVSVDFGAPSSLEIALAMRDAIYCISTGMTINWIACEEGVPNLPVGLRNDIVHVPTLADFVQDLKHSLPIGVHLARIGRDSTAIGIKKPGRIAYMSSLKVDPKTGGMTQEAPRGAHLAAKLDINGFALRFPQWFIKAYRGSNVEYTDAKIKTIAQISRDSMIWLAMMMELCNQEMGKIDPGTIRLTESARLAISHDSIQGNLPVPYSPSWTLTPPSLEEMLNSLELCDWELGFLRESLTGIDPLDFIPVSETLVGMHLIDRKIVPRPERRSVSFIRESHDVIYVPFISISEGIAGTEEEIQAVVRSIYRKNLADYLLNWGNRKFAQHWKEDTEWFREKLTANALVAMDAPFSKVQNYDYERWSAPYVFKQSPRHKGFKPLCFIKGKGECDVKTHVHPRNADEIVQALGLSSQEELPAHLRGWSRDQGWTTGRGVTQQNPAVTTERWYFMCDEEGYYDDPQSSYEGFIYFNSANHPTGAKKPRW